MCGEVVAAPLSLQDTVYPILRKKSLHFCEISGKFLKLCTARRKKYKMKRLRSRACSNGQRARPLRLLTAFASTLPLLSLRDIFPRRGGSLSSKGEALAKR